MKHTWLNLNPISLRKNDLNWIRGEQESAQRELLFNITDRGNEY